MRGPTILAHRHRGSALLLVLWTVGLTTLVLVSLQMSAYRQAASGRDAMGQVRAKWAARAGVEAYVTYLRWQAEHADRTSPGQIRAELEELAVGEFEGAIYRVEHTTVYGEPVLGPENLHAKLNVNLMTPEQWLELDGMDEMILAAIQDWMDADDDPREGGAESSYYRQMDSPYEPRQGAIQSLRELELILGVTPELLRGEDWNLNGILDPNEDDGDLSWPNDNQNGRLEAGWSAYITVSSRAVGLGRTGEAKLNLRDAEVQEVQKRLNIDSSQAEAILALASSGGATMETLALTPLSQLAGGGQDGEQQQGISGGIRAPGGSAGGAGRRGGNQRGGNQLGGNQRGGNQAGGGASGAGGGASTPNVRDLSREQIVRLLDEAMMGDSTVPRPGRVDLNEAPVEVLELLPGIDEQTASRIVAERQGRSQGFTSILDLEQSVGLSREELAALAPLVDVRSNTYRIVSRGITSSGRTQYELDVTIDRTGLPLRISEYLER